MKEHKTLKYGDFTTYLPSNFLDKLGSFFNGEVNCVKLVDNTTHLISLHNKETTKN